VRTVFFARATRCARPSAARREGSVTSSSLRHRTYGAADQCPADGGRSRLWPRRGPPFSTALSPGREYVRVVNCGPSPEAVPLRVTACGRCAAPVACACDGAEGSGPYGAFGPVHRSPSAVPGACLCGGRSAARHAQAHAPNALRDARHGGRRCVCVARVGGSLPLCLAMCAAAALSLGQELRVHCVSSWIVARLRRERGANLTADAVTVSALHSNHSDSFRTTTHPHGCCPKVSIQQLRPRKFSLQSSRRGLCVCSAEFVEATLPVAQPPRAVLCVKSALDVACFFPSVRTVFGGRSALELLEWG